MNRSSDIQSKFEYAERLWQQLMTETFRAKKERVQAKDIVFTSSHILSETRECYDYCANDIVDVFIIPRTCNQEILRKYSLEKLNIYFPFHESQLTRHDSVFRELREIESSLYEYLVSLYQSIAQNSQIPKTEYSYGGILMLRDIVNKKKHNHLYAVKSEAEQEVLVNGAHMKMVIPIKEQRGKAVFHVERGAYVSLVSEFRFEFNNQEVTSFCRYAITATKHVLNDIYTAFFSSPLISPK